MAFADFPPLCDLARPTAPLWREMRATPGEVEGLRLQHVVIVGVDRASGRIEPLGTGFIVFDGPTCYVVTALHVLTGYANRVVGVPPRQAIPPTPEEEARADLDRVGALVNEDRFGVLIESSGPREILLRFPKAVYSSADYRALDAAIFFIDHPESARYSVLPIDEEPPAPNEIVMISGFIGMQPFSWDDLQTGGRAARSRLCIRAGRLKDVTQKSRSSRVGTPLFRCTIPSIHGMSGGPLTRLRFPKGRFAPLIGTTVPEMLTAAGVVSAGGYGGGLTYQDLEPHLKARPLGAEVRPLISTGVPVELTPLLREKITRAKARYADQNAGS